MFVGDNSVVQLDDIEMLLHFVVTAFRWTLVLCYTIANALNLWTVVPGPRRPYEKQTDC